MKICPTCRKTYSDDGLNFCLDDGSVLTFASGGQPETVMMNQLRMTNQAPPMRGRAGVQPSWGNQPQYSMQPKKSSKAWLWILGILAIFLVLCGGGGVAGLIFLANSNNSRSSDRSNTPTNKRNTSSTSPNATPFTSADVEKVDLSDFVQDFSIYGTTEMVGDELMMASKQKQYYYVLAASDDFTTEASATKITLRNVDNASSSLGYGLVFHSDPKPLTKGYAFLIDAKKKRYRVVRHEPGKETPVIVWTNSALIKDGSLENVLEIRDKGAVIELFINDQMVNSIKDAYGHPNGVPGLYSGDAAKIAFKNLEIRK